MGAPAVLHLKPQITAAQLATNDTFVVYDVSTSLLKLITAAELAIYVAS